MGRAQQVRPTAFAGIGLLLLTLTTGCSTCKDWFDPYREGDPPTGHVTRIDGYWEKSLYGGRDTVHNGAPVAGYGGRIFLVDSADGTDRHVVGNGKVVVYCYDDAAPMQPNHPTNAVEYWEFDPQTLKRLVKKDTTFGYGYNLFLPSEHPLSKVHFLVVYQEDKGQPIYSGEMGVTIDAVQSMNTYARTYSPGQPTVASAGQQQQAPAVMQTAAYGPVGNPATPNALPAGIVPATGVQGPASFSQYMGTPNLASLPQNQTNALQPVQAQPLPTAVQYGPITNQAGTASMRYVIVPGTPGQPTAQVSPR